MIRQAIAALFVCTSARALAQPGTSPRLEPRRAAWNLAANVAAGAGVALARSLLTGKDRTRATLVGAAGGGASGLGKWMYSRNHTPTAKVGYVVSVLGASLVNDAGGDHQLLQSIDLPVGSFRINMRRDSSGVKWGVRVDLLETAVAVHTFARHDLSFDSGESWRRLAFVFRNENPIYNGRDYIGGLATGSVVIVSDAADSRLATLRHEFTHVHQRQYLQTVAGKPLEVALLRRLNLARGWPSWLDAGIFPSLLLLTEAQLTRSSRQGPFRRLLEREAEQYEACLGFEIGCPRR